MTAWPEKLPRELLNAWLPSTHLLHARVGEEVKALGPAVLGRLVPERRKSAGAPRSQTLLLVGTEENLRDHGLTSASWVLCE